MDGYRDQHGQAPRRSCRVERRSALALRALAGAILLSMATATAAHAQNGVMADPPATQEFAPPSADVPAAKSPAPSVTELRPLGAPGRALPKGPAGAAKPQVSGSAWILQTSISLGAVIALALAAGWVLRSLARKNGGLRASLGAGGRAPAGVLEILGRYPVGRGATLVLLKLDRRVLLLAQSATGRLGGSGFSMLSEITDPEEVASILVKTRDDDGDSMAERFRSMLGRHDRDLQEITGDGGTAGGRRVQSGSGGDSAEVWDTARGTIPIVDLTRQPGPEEQGAAVTLRRRLAALKRAGEGVA